MSATTPDVETLAQQVQLKKRKVEEYKHGHLKGMVTYDELAGAGRELSEAMFAYSKAKFPAIKARRIPYQSIIR